MKEASKMEELKNRLRTEIQQSFDVTILSEQVWTLIARKVSVTYQTITRTTMDVLMKMILITLRQLPVEQEEEIVSLLGVEKLFVNDLLTMMERSGLIEKNEFWIVTATGIAQLESGMLIHETQQVKATLLVSPFHNGFLRMDKKLLSEENLPVFRYENELESWSVKDLSDTLIENELASQVESENTVDRQCVIDRILKVEEIGKMYVPCLEFHLHNTSQDTLYARVWNSATEQWDEMLEQLVMLKERSSWRRQYIEKKEEQ